MKSEKYKKYKKSYWHIMKEKHFTDWLESFNIDLEYTSCKRNVISTNKEYELGCNELDIVITWIVSPNEYNSELGGCVTSISLETWNSGILNTTKYIKIEKTSKFDIKQTYNIIGGYSGHQYKYYSDNNNDKISHILNELDEFLMVLNERFAKKHIRSKKLNNLLS